MTKNKIIATLFLTLFSVHVFAAALSWLNPPEIDIGLEGNSMDSLSVISANGQYVAFYSTSSNLILDDSNAAADVFVKNRQTNEISIVSTNAAGVQVTISAFISSPTNDGKYIAIMSGDENMPLRPSNASTFDDFIYIKDIQSGNVHTPLHAGSAIEAERGSVIYLSANGQYLYFTTPFDLVANDTNNDSDAYIYDRINTSFELVSINSSGVAAGGAKLLSISNNGRYVTYEADDGSPGASPEYGYVRDLNFSTTVMYTVDNNGDPVNDSTDSAEVSNNGIVYFCSPNDTIVAGDTNDLDDIFVYNAGVVTLFPFPNLVGEITDTGCSRNSKIFVNNNDTKFYFSHFSDQIDTSLSDDSKYKIIFVNLDTQQSTIINQVDGEIFTAASLSASNSLNDIAFVAHSSVNLAGIDSKQLKAMHYNTQNSEFSVIHIAVFAPETQNSGAGLGLMSDNQNWVLYATNADNVIPYTSNKPLNHLYLLNRSNSEVKRIGENIAGLHDMSPNGRYITFSSLYSQDGNTLLLDSYYLFLYDQNSQSYSQIVSQVGYWPRVNNDGNIVFSSRSSTLVANDNNGYEDVFFYDKSNSSIQLISINTSGGVGNNYSNSPDIGGSGTSTWIVFQSMATDLIAADTNNFIDVFLYNWPAGQISRVSEVAGVGGNESSARPRISNDTTTIIFSTLAENLIGETVQTDQMMVYDRILDTRETITRDYLGNFPIESDEATYIGLPSSNGRYIAMRTKAKLLANDVSDSGRSDDDVYIYDRQTNLMTRMTQYDDGSNYQAGSTLMDFTVDESQNPHLLSVLFTNRNYLSNDYLGLDQATHDISQLYLLQSGGEGNTVAVTVTGTGAVSGNLGFNCNDNCSQTYVLGQTISLLATADVETTFIHWQGDVCHNSTALTCEIYINSDKSVEAVFTIHNDAIFNNGFEN